MVDGHVDGSGILKRNMERPLRAWKYSLGSGGVPGAGCTRTALEGGNPGPWKRRLLWRNVVVAE